VPVLSALRPGFFLAPGMKVGLLGGSFNPAHEGHAHVADTGRRALGLDKVLWLVSPQNPLKETGETAPLAERLAQTQKIAYGPFNIVTGLEADLGSPYTIDTIRWLKTRYPGVRFIWLMGSDNLESLHFWRDWRAIPQAVEVAVIPRPGSTVHGRLAPGGRLLAASGRARVLGAPLNNASSTALRERVKGRS
jgi:nicotinate-nucleotide adenylyltransferase